MFWEKSGKRGKQKYASTSTTLTRKRNWARKTRRKRIEKIEEKIQIKKQISNNSRGPIQTKAKELVDWKEENINTLLGKNQIATTARYITETTKEPLSRKTKQQELEYDDKEQQRNTKLTSFTENQKLPQSKTKRLFSTIWFVLIYISTYIKIWRNAQPR